MRESACEFRIERVETAEESAGRSRPGLEALADIATDTRPTFAELFESSSKSNAELCIFNERPRSSFDVSWFADEESPTARAETHLRLDQRGNDGRVPYESQTSQ